MNICRKLILIVSLAFTTAAQAQAQAQAQDRPYQLVCFEQTGITDSLDKVVNMQQFLRNDRILQSGSCGFAQIPVGSSARYVGIHSSPQGFLYPVYRVTYATTGQRMYAADGVFRADQWRVRQQRGSQVSILTPVSCDVLDGYVQATSRMPRYIAAPEICDVEIIR